MINQENKRMLIIRFSALGDVAMTIPAIYSFANRYPTLTIDVATRPFFARLFINPPENVNVIGIDFKGEYKGVKGSLQLLKRLGKLRPDYVADLHNVLRSWVIDRYFKLRGVKVEMVDKMRSQRNELFCTGEPQTSFIDRYAEVFARLGFPIELTFKSLYSKDFQSSLPLQLHHPAVGIAPFARYFNKTYPQDLMHEVISRLSADGYNVYLFGGRGEEAEKLKTQAEGIENCTSLAGLYPLEEEIAIMGAMDVMVSMDSSNQHMAALAGVPVVSIWGSTTPACGFLGYGQSTDNAVSLGISCQPCSVGGAPTCPKGHFDCMMKLKPDVIIEKIKAILSKHQYS